MMDDGYSGEEKRRNESIREKRFFSQKDNFDSTIVDTTLDNNNKNDSLSSISSVHNSPIISPLSPKNSLSNTTSSSQSQFQLSPFNRFVDAGATCGVAVLISDDENCDKFGRPSAPSFSQMKFKKKKKKDPKKPGKKNINVKVAGNYNIVTGNLGDSEIFLFSSLPPSYTPSHPFIRKLLPSTSKASKPFIPSYFQSYSNVYSHSTPDIKFPIECSYRHVASDPEEQNRCVAAGGELDIIQPKQKRNVEMNKTIDNASTPTKTRPPVYRMNGLLVTRTFGDFNSPQTISEPYVAVLLIFLFINIFN
jgi:hypothetical protein